MADPAAEVRLRPATEADWPLIRRWLAMPEIVRWWGPAAASEAEVRLALSSAHAICRIVETPAGEPIGYAHAVDAVLWSEALPDGYPAGAWDADLFIAVPDHRGRGAGRASLRLLVEEVFATTLAVGVTVFTAVGNESAVRAYEAAGFRWARVVRTPDGGAEWMMVLERTGIRTR